MPTIHSLAPRLCITSSLPKRSPAKPRVLLVDDHGLLKALTRVLEHDCHLVGHATTLAKMFELVEICQPDVVVLEFRYRMQSYRRVPATPSVKPAVNIVMLTAMDDEDIRDAALRAEASDFVTKALVEARPQRIKGDVRCARYDSSGC